MIGKNFFLNARKGAFSEIPESGSYQHHFTDIKGHLVHVAFKPTAKGDTMRLHIVNEVDFFIVSMFVRSRPTNAFMLMARNLDLHAEMKFVMSLDEEGKDVLKVFQYGESVRWYYTKENADELPPSADEKRAFLRRIIETDVIPVLKRKMNPYPNHSIYKPLGSGKGLATEYFDDFKNVATIRKNHLSDEDDLEMKTQYRRHF